MLWFLITPPPDQETQRCCCPSLLSPWLPAALRPPLPPVTAAAAAAAEGGLLRRPQSRHRSNLLAGWVGLGWVASGDGDTDEEIPKHPSLRSAVRQLVLPRDGSMTQKRGFSEFAKSQGPSFPPTPGGSQNMIFFLLSYFVKKKE